MPAITLARPTIRLSGAASRAARATETPSRGLPWASLFLLAATAAYLCVELPFAAHLVDIVSTSASPAEIHAVERTGRLVSGAALALAAWGWLLRPRKPVAAGARIPARKPVTTLLLMSAVAAVCIGGMMVGQRSLIDRVASISDANFRRAAMKGAVLRHTLIERPATAKGDLAPAPVRAGASWSAFLGAVPALSVLGGDAFPSLRSPGESVAAYVAAGPTLAEFRRDGYAPAIQATRTAFVRYREGVDRLAVGRRDNLRRMDEAWNELWGAIRSKGIADVAQPHAKRQILDRVRARGIPVPDGWDARDRATFEAAFLRQSDQALESSYIQTVEGNLGRGARLPTTLTRYEDFLAAPAVQDSLRKTLGIDKATQALKPGPSDAELWSAAYLPARAGQTRLLMEALTSNPLMLTTDDRLRGPAEDAVRLAVAPALALVLSALGAFGHMAKMLHHLLGALGATSGRPAILRIAASALLLGILVASVAVPAAIASTSAWKSASGSPQGKAIGWAIGAHGLLHPVGTALSALPGLQAATWVATRSGIR